MVKFVDIGVWEKLQPIGTKVLNSNAGRKTSAKNYPTTAEDI